MLNKYAKRNGVKNYKPAQFTEEVTIMIEQLDVDDSAVQPKSAMVEEGEGFDHLLPAQIRQGSSKDMIRPSTSGRLDINNRHMTSTGVVYRPTIRETVANLHETVTGIRITSHLFLIGVDKT